MSPYGLCDGKMTSCFYVLSLFAFRCPNQSKGLDELLCDRPALFNVRDRGLPFSVLNLIPLLGELELVEPKLPLGQFFDFRLGIDAGRLFDLPYPVQAKRDLCDPGLSSRNLLFPLSVRFFTGRPARCSLLNGLQLRLL